MLAQNKCCECDHEWSDAPGGWAQKLSTLPCGYCDNPEHQKLEACCPKCESFYFKWTNYEYTSISGTDYNVKNDWLGANSDHTVGDLAEMLQWLEA